LLKDAGFDRAERVPSDGSPGVFATLDAGAPKTVGLYFMYDAKQVEPAEWSSPPWGAAILDVLENAGFDVVMAANGQEALQALVSERRTSLILFDLKMPVMDGLEFRRRQLQNPLLASVPVALVSGDSRGQAEANRLGFAGSFKKPFGVPELLALARRYCGEH